MKTHIRPIQRLPKRAVELLTKRYFLGLVGAAYRDAGGKDRKLIMKNARKWYGYDNSDDSLIARWFMDFVFQAQLDLFHDKIDLPDLGTSPIGYEDLQIECSASDANSSSVYLLGFSDNASVFPIYKRYASPNSVALDVGANIGIHTLVLSRCVGRHGRVISFEPSTRIYQRLITNLEVNSTTNVCPMQHGVAAHSGSVRFEDYCGDFNIGKGRIAASGSCEISVSTIDEEARDCGLPISLLKIDIVRIRTRGDSGCAANSCDARACDCT